MIDLPLPLLIPLLVRNTSDFHFGLCIESTTSESAISDVESNLSIEDIPVQMSDEKSTCEAVFTLPESSVSNRTLPFPCFSRKWYKNQGKVTKQNCKFVPRIHMKRMKKEE